MYTFAKWHKPNGPESTWLPQVIYIITLDARQISNCDMGFVRLSQSRVQPINLLATNLEHIYFFACSINPYGPKMLFEMRMHPRFPVAETIQVEKSICVCYKICNPA